MSIVESLCNCFLVLNVCRYGRKTSISISSVIYIICGPVAAVSQSYWLFVAARVGLGIAGSGVYHSGYTVCK